MTKVMVIVPTAGTVKPETETAIQALGADDVLIHRCQPIHDHQNRFAKTALNATHTRNEARRVALKSDCTHFLWIDSDVVPPQNTIEQLLRMENDSAAGWYPVRDNDHIIHDRWVAGTFTEDGEFANYHFPWVIKEGDPDTHPLGDLVMDIRTKKFRRQPTISHLAPLGCLMITREVMELLEFEHGTNYAVTIAGLGVVVPRCDCLQFGLQLYELGVITHMSPRILCRHIP